MNAHRLRDVNARPVREDGEYVVYWMTSFRRARFNFALDRAVERCAEFGKPLLVLEALRAGYPYASDRLHRFVIDGMEDNARRFADAGVAHHAYLEPAHGEGRGLLAALADRACVVVTDDWPSFFVPRMIAAAGAKLDVLLEAVDGNGLLPIASTDRIFTTAHSFRRHLQKNIRPRLREFPLEDPLSADGLAGARLPDKVESRWPDGTDVDLADLPIDHEVPPVDLRGGERAAGEVLDRFVRERLPRYAEDRNRPLGEATSGLSPYLHFGHVSSHEVFRAVADAEGWDESRISSVTDGRRAGFWGMSEAAEAFIDQVVTWREVGFHTAAKLDGYDEYEALPGFAQKTLADHADDPREHVYALEEFEAAKTHDPLWNAAQNQLRREGVIHNYLRMLWGKKILEWSATPRDALATMLRLNDRWALDGRDPNSVSGIFWCLGRYDRGWGPERPVFGKIRYMSSENTARKVRVTEYLERYG